MRVSLWTCSPVKGDCPVESRLQYFKEVLPMRKLLAPLFLCFAMVVVLAAVSCGGGSSSATPSSPSPTPTPTPTPSTGATITITSSGVSPRSVTIAAGSRVTFVNNDSRVHQMASDPHPVHTACPEINQGGVLSAGQSRQTGNLNTPRTCDYHDHLQDSNTSLKGTIVIQ